MFCFQEISIEFSNHSHSEKKKKNDSTAAWISIHALSLLVSYRAMGGWSHLARGGVHPGRHMADTRVVFKGYIHSKITL